MKKVLLFSGTLLIAFAVGAATGTKITAELQSKSISYNGTTNKQSVIVYKGEEYMKVKSLATLSNIAYSNKNGAIFLGEPKAEQKKYKFVINKVSSLSTRDDGEFVTIDLSFTNNSGESKSPSDSQYLITAYQGGASIDRYINVESEGNDEYTSVLKGCTVSFKSSFIITDKSPVTIEVTDTYGKDKISKTFNLQ